VPLGLAVDEGQPYAWFIVQDIAAEQSTMTFRAPELFDVKTGITLDEKVDIWVRIYVPLMQRLTRSTITVTRMHTLRTCIQPLAL
jgi:hypothetical protein